MSQSTPSFDQPFLGEPQRELAKQAFSLGATPLREEFKEQNIAREEDLFRRGIQFGGIGDTNREKSFTDQDKRFTDLASSIAVPLGQTALEQAFNVNEAAKQREFQGTQADLDRSFQQDFLGQQQQFAGGQSELDRALQRSLQSQQLGQESDLFGRSQAFEAEQSGLGRGLQRELQTGQQGFAAGQSALDRALQERLFGQEFQQQQQLLGQQQGFTGSQSALDRALSQALQSGQFQQQQQLLGQEQQFVGGQSALDRALSQVLQTGQFQQQAGLLGQEQQFQAGESALSRQQQLDLVNQDKQQQNQRLALQLGLEGALTGAPLDAALSGLFGGGQLRTQDQLDLQRAATAAGLTPEQFQEQRSFLGGSQLEAILANPSDFIEDPQRDRRLQLLMAQLAGGGQGDAALRNELFGATELQERQNQVFQEAQQNRETIRQDTLGDSLNAQYASFDSIYGKGNWENTPLGRNLTPEQRIERLGI